MRWGLNNGVYMGVGYGAVYGVKETKYFRGLEMLQDLGDRMGTLN